MTAVTVDGDTVSDLTTASALTGSELLYLVQSDTDKKITANALTRVKHNTTTNSLFIGGVGNANLTSGGASVFVGLDGLQAATTIGDSTSVGVGNFQYVQTGNGSCAFGRLSLNLIEDSFNNTAYGDSTLRSAQGEHLTAIGYVAGDEAITGDWNIYIGAYCASDGTNKGSHNIIVGSYACSGTVTLGTYNIVLGETTAFNMTGSHNFAAGFETLYGATGSYLIAIGENAAQTVTASGAINSIFIGRQSGTATGVQKTDPSNVICIGFDTFSTTDNTVVLGNTSIVSTILRGKITGPNGINFNSQDVESVGGPASGPGIWNSGNGVLITAGSSLGFRINNSTNGAQLLGLTNAGALGLGRNASSGYKFDVSGAIGFAPGSSVTPANNGDVVFQLTSNTQLTIKAKGSDGTVRSANITLA